MHSASLVQSLPVSANSQRLTQAGKLTDSFSRESDAARASWGLVQRTSSAEHRQRLAAGMQRPMQALAGRHRQGRLPCHAMPRTRTCLHTASCIPVSYICSLDLSRSASNVSTVHGRVWSGWGGGEASTSTQICKSFRKESFFGVM